MVHISAHIHIVEGQRDAFRTTKSGGNFVSPQLEVGLSGYSSQAFCLTLIMQRDYKFATECTFQFSFAALLHLSTCMSMFATI